MRLHLFALALLAIAVLAACGNGADSGPSAEAASSEEVQQILERRCYACHSENPTDEEFKNFDLPKWDDPDNVMRFKDRIYDMVVVSKRMPQGNRTNMTQEERDRIAEWAESAE